MSAKTDQMQVIEEKLKEIRDLLDNIENEADDMECERRSEAINNV